MGMLNNSCKKNDSSSAESLVLGKLARHLCLQSTFLVGERDTIRAVQIQAGAVYVYIYINNVKKRFRVALKSTETRKS